MRRNSALCDLPKHEDETHAVTTRRALQRTHSLEKDNDRHVLSSPLISFNTRESDIFEINIYQTDCQVRVSTHVQAQAQARTTANRPRLWQIRSSHAIMTEY